MGRATKYNRLTDSASIAAINPENAQLLNDFLEYLRSVQRSASTIEVYRNDLEIAFVWAEKRIANLPYVKWTKRHFMQFQNYLVNENGNSPARVRRVKATLSSLGNFIENVLDDEYPNFRNVVHKIESPPAATVREKTVLSDEEAEGLLRKVSEAGEHERACLLALAMYSGRRKSELVRFKVSYFDDANVIYGSLFKTPECVKTKGRGNGKFIYCYTLANDFKPYFNKWMEYRKENGIDSEWLFPDRTDPTKPLSPNTVSGWTRMFSKFAGKEIYLHAFRHYFTTHLVRMGLPDGVIQDIIGWTSADMLRIYTDIEVDEQLGKYFDENGIKQVASARLSDL